MQLFVKQDTEHLTTLLEYKEDTGELVFFEDLKVDWVRPGTEQENESTFTYTPRCLKTMDIRLMERSISSFE